MEELKNIKELFDVFVEKSDRFIEQVKENQNQKGE